ncbi:uncharacterized protein At1g24485-like [Humulus lupulus]|uniref:uncharacterized protein At1g24485-like n=1 Tax=Humulus lupulus TaxID=3486 RepID=UPI002B410B33|nr:uncharacterized protein At1g24485-like [Humulus lupulus]
MEYRTTIVLVLTLLPVLHSFQVPPLALDWISIDCGSTSTAVLDNTTYAIWETDELYIQTGENNNILSTATKLPQLATLRSFPNGSKNCYNLPLQIQSKYLIRAGFQYGNYDNLQSPPTFGLQLQSSQIDVNVTTSLDSDPIYHEFIIFTDDMSVLDVCLIGTQGNQVPFISTLEAAMIDQKDYRLMPTNKALYLESRINYGVDSSVPYRFPPYVEPYNRMWEPQQDPRYVNLYTGSLGPMVLVDEENSPPDVVMLSAIEAHNTSESIIIPIDFRDKSQVSAYFVLYFDASAKSLAGGGSRIVAIYIDGLLINTTQLPVPDFVLVTSGDIVSIYPYKVTGGTTNLTISPAQGTSSPAILNAVEVFSVIDMPNKQVTTDAAGAAPNSSPGTFPLQLLVFSYWLFYFAVYGFRF